MSEDNWKQPLEWNAEAEREGKQRKVFCGSMCDVMDEEAPTGQRERLWKLIDATPYLIWQLLTKRPGSYDRLLPESFRHKNVWLGCSAENQRWYDKRWPLLLSAASKRGLIAFVSYEPALGPLVLSGHATGPDWVICGGESAPDKKRREIEPGWAENLIAEIREKFPRTVFFMKQMSARTSPQAQKLVPAHLLIRQWPGSTSPEKPLSPLKIAKAKAVAEVATREESKALAKRQELEGKISAEIKTMTMQVTETPAEIITVRMPVVYETIERPLPVARKTTEEKSFSKTPEIRGQFDAAKATDVVFDGGTEVDRLKAEANEIATELFGHISKLGGRLTSVLLRIKEQLPHGEWTAWYEEFRERYSLKSLRQVQRDFKQLTTGDVESEDENEGSAEDESAEDGREEPEDSPAPIVYESPAELLTKRLKELHTVLSDGTAPVDANPIRDAEGRNTKALELVESVQLAIDEGLLDQPADGCITCMHRGIADLALANPGWTDEQLAEASGRDITMVRQARIRFLAWKGGVA